MTRPQRCPVCQTGLAPNQYGGYPCPAGHGYVVLNRCVGCDRLYEAIWTADGIRHSHRCDEADPREGPDVMPLDSGKSFDDRLRDAEILDRDSGEAPDPEPEE